MNAPEPVPLIFPFPAPAPPGACLEVLPGVRWLRMPLPFALDHINLWLLKDGDGWTQIDCGIADDTTRELWQSHFVTSLEHRAVQQVIATHYHPDHMGNAEWLTSHFGCALVTPQAEFQTGHAVIEEQGAFG